MSSFTNRSYECAQARPSYRIDALVQDTPYMHFSTLLLCWTLAFFSTTLALLVWLKHSHRGSLLHIKTSWIRIVCFDLSCLCFLVVGPVRDLVGYERFVCDIELWFRVLGVFCLIAALSLEITFLRNKILLASVLDKANFATLQDFAKRENNKTFIKSESRRKVIKSARFGAALPLSSSPTREAATHESEDTLKHQLQRALWTNSTAYRIAFTTFVNLTPLVICCIVIQFSMPFYGHGCVNCLLTQYHMVIVCVFGGLPGVFFAYHAWQLRGAKDRFGTLHALARDFAIALPVAILASVLYCVNYYIGSPIDEGTFSPDWLLVGMLNVLHYIEVPREIHLAFQRRRRGGGGAAEARAGFEALLANADGLAVFTRYLESEYNAENIRFYVHAKAYREGFPGFRNAMQAKLAAEEIYWTFCHQGAVLEINLPDAVRQQVFAQLNHHRAIGAGEEEGTSSRRDVFLPAEKEIFNLMLNDSYARFTRSEQGQAWSTRSTTMMLVPSPTAPPPSPKFGSSSQGSSTNLLL